ncbi:unnamed protein product [Medioppia subpectinata]|uniref:Wiskott-Aldrich syndrome protein family member n=1 Tax=Medioppia subpectinata TaxID=1979941 RepID=A0A7R9PTA1_9ACAR|nr:unnamed protein product [Medioppia subpectinata]CAG2100428.1 unnamed protein product [Medioppia subpectinata]
MQKLLTISIKRWRYSRRNLCSLLSPFLEALFAMPFEQRVIAPIACGRGCVPMDSAGQLAINIPNELECVTNGTLANIIRQLSSLSRFAEDLFGSILSEASLLVLRSSALQSRIDRLGDKVLSLDSTVEEVSLQDIHLRKAFKSSLLFAQQVVARDTIPTNIHAVYAKCDPPPALSALNVYRDDGKDGLKFYTDPNYFFDLWRQEMLADTEKALAGRARAPRGKLASEHKKSRKPRQPANTRERYRQMMTNQGEFILEQKSNGEEHFQEEQRPQSLELNSGFYIENHAPPQWSAKYEHDQVQQLNQYNAQQIYATRRQTSASRPSQPPPAPPSSGPSTPQHTQSSQQHERSRVRDTLPPPPPPPETAHNGVEPEPPPPPPPPMLPSGGGEKRQQLPTVSELKSIQLKKVEVKERIVDPRSDLLAAIREGIKLKRVEDCKQREVEKCTPLHDVASILARRVAIELSDSEGGGDDDDDSDAWDDESEC